MTEMTCPGWRASWVNAWLAAVGATVLDERIRLSWTNDSDPVAVLSAEPADPVAVLLESWPDVASLSELPIAEDWRGAARLQRRVPAEAFATRVRAARSHEHSWTLSSTVTDLSVDERGEVAHAPFDPAGPGTIKWLHHRLVKVYNHIDDPAARLRESLAGEADRVRDNGLGFDQTRLGSLQDATDPWVDPVVEVLAFFGLALLPVRGRGADRQLDRSADVSARQRGWREVDGTRERRSFHWPAWSQPLDSDGIDALLDAWSPERRGGWARLGVHAGWQSVQFERRSSADSTRAIGAARL
ncbi:MAG: hypothetical protein F4X80_09290 [Chloroflexi bacterium]|nr:hypothetical protein [Chloroflexota bacterium]MYE32824.1 hypothetical protein [Chloroflexota bacterium]